ncbi:permease [Bradyrhizobium sp. CCBAU 25338]|nr:permease [Bradyrhizobium sp. CCBAU 45389]MDA9527325.1 permease [Bradyrhizobium sp. CCBAU 25338]RXH24314.1 permease [Bradyrhizobium nanningense]
MSRSERFDAIDVLRGLALFGVLAMNIVTIFRVSFYAPFLPNAEPAGPLDRVVAAVLTVAVDWKALALFSLLFGVGLVIQFERLAGDARRMILLVRRLVVLLAIGLVHLCLIWNGDILVEYALAGFVVLPFLGGARWLMAGAALLLLGLYVTTPVLPPIVPLPEAAGMAGLAADAMRAYGTGGFFDVLAFRIREVPAIFSAHVMVFPRTVALFLVGALAWRSGVLRRASANRRLLFVVATFGIPLGGGLSLAAAGQGLFDWPSLGRAHFPVEQLGAVVLALGYAAAVIAAVNLAGGRRMLGWAAPLGRMALTNYLAQSVICGWIFYGYGLGQFGRLGVAATLTIGIFVYVAQVVFSAWWLRRYRFGPVEWLWRSCMYGVPQPMRATVNLAIMRATIAD